MRPLDRVPSIKLKLGMVIVLAVVASSVLVTVAASTDLPTVVGPIAGVLVALGLVQVLARGMTSPLREMAQAATRLAKGDWDRPVTTSSADEVGDLARAFNVMAAELAEVDRVRRDLVANVSHELRTPISALRARLENLVDGVEPAAPETLQVMLDQVERLGRLVEQLLDLSRLEAGVVPLDPVRFDAGALLERVAAEFSVHAGGTPIEVQVGEGRPAGLGDPERMHQVVANLVDNAVRHSPPGQPVRLEASRSSDGGLRIDVVDRGPGIDPAVADRVFERFWRADRARAADGSGAGLGLAIAQWIVELHGGVIGVADAVAGAPGCRMFVELPASGGES